VHDRGVPRALGAVHHPNLVGLAAGPHDRLNVGPQWNQFGGRVHRPYSATGVRQIGEHAEVTLESGDVIQAQYVVAADGMDSTIRDPAGLGYAGNDTLPISFALADVRGEGGLATDQVLLVQRTAIARQVDKE
jgi:hypothetical protein